jgi:hypothetical protein
MAAVGDAGGAPWTVTDREGDRGMVKPGKTRNSADERDFVPEGTSPNGFTLHAIPISCHQIV